MSINLVPATLAVGPHQEKHWAKCDEKKGPKRVQKMLVDVAHGAPRHWTRKPCVADLAAEWRWSPPVSGLSWKTPEIPY